MRLLPKNRELGWAPYAWLAYILIFLSTPFLNAASPRIRTLTIGAVAVFLPLYFWGYWLHGRRTLYAVGGIALLGSLCAPFNAGASVFFTFAACFVGEAAQPAEAFGYLAGLLAWIGLEAWLLHLPMQFWIPALFFSTLLGASDIHFAQQRRMNRKLKMAQDEVEHMAKVAERERIARDLHDVLGHTLSLIILKSELASKLAEKDPARATMEIRDVERISREALAQVRAAVRGYQASGIVEEFRHARETLELAGIAPEVDVEPLAMSPAQEGVLVLALREAVTNVIRHARATACKLSLRGDGVCCELEIADNGPGSAAGEGFGLSSMRHRVESLGGLLERSGMPGNTLRIRLPLKTA
jgi:two-component system sensor histidine kinase DesK